MINKGYLTANKTSDGDEMFTPAYAVIPIIKYAKEKGFKKIWCPFDKENSEFVRILSTNGFDVIRSHIDDGLDFFTYAPLEQFDCIISNPPFSKKDLVLQRLTELNKSYAILLPLPSLQGQKRFAYLDGCQALIFDKRIDFYSNLETKEVKKGVSFATIYVCKNFLPKDLIFEKLDKTLIL